MLEGGEYATRVDVADEILDGIKVLLLLLDSIQGCPGAIVLVAVRTNVFMRGLTPPLLHGEHGPVLGSVLASVEVVGVSGDSYEVTSGVVESGVLLCFLKDLPRLWGPQQ